MEELLKKARIKFVLNIVLPSILAVILFVVTLFFVVVPYFEKSMMDRKREMITELTNTATSILAKYHKDELDGLLTREEAQETAISRLEYLRYGEENKDYFWITDMQPVMIVHPYRPELNGKDLSNFEDSHGKKLFVECVKVVKENQHGYVEYMWQWKDDSTQIVPKLSYVKSFEPWGWIVGTGIYIEDVKAEINGLTKRFIIISIIISSLISLILLYVGRQSFNIERKRIAAEIELNHSREKYRSLVDASTEGLVMMVDDKISFVNSVFEKLSGFSVGEIMEMNLDDLFKIPEILLQKLKNDSELAQISEECKILASGDRYIDVILSVNRIDFYGQDALIFSVKDVSPDKLVKEELLNSREKFQSLMDKLNQGIFRTSIDMKGKFIEANQTALRIFGYSNYTEIEGLYILDFFVEKQDKLTFRNNLLKQGFIKNQLIKLRKKNGEHIHAAVSLIVVYDKGQPKFCDGIIQDISVQSGMKSDSSEINNDYITFMQQLYVPVSRIAREAIVCPYDLILSTAVEKMNREKAGLILVASTEGEILGYVTDKIIRERAISMDSSDVQLFKIMNSPIDFVNETDSVFDVLSVFSKNKELDFVVVISSSGDSYIQKKDLLFLQEYLPLKVLGEINDADDFRGLKTIHDKYILSLLPVIDTSSDSSLVFNNLSFISDSVCIKLINQGIEKFGEPPTKFCFVTLGSEGRKEQTLSTDQDNAIVFKDVDESEFENVKQYFDSLAEYVCNALDVIGYDFCVGGIMAKNTEYCQSSSIWKNYFNKWINTGTGKNLLDISVFFDMRVIYGEKQMVEDIREYIDLLTAKNPAYLMLLAQNSLKLKPQVGFWGNILLETAGAPPETVNIKETITPITNFARIYSLKYNVNEVSTIGRLKNLRNENILSESSFQNILQAYKYLQLMRLKQQSNLIGKGLKPDNLINTKHLSDLDKTIIKKVLSHINSMLSKLSYDFKGTM
jgi:PAS domain S-box-containing protein